MMMEVGPDADLETVASALVTLSQVHGAKPSDFAPTTAPPAPPAAAAATATAGRTKRERKLPAKLTSGDFVCEAEGIPVAKTARSAYDQTPSNALHQLHSFHSDGSYTLPTTGKGAYPPAYSVAGHSLHFAGASAAAAAAGAFASSSSKRKQRMPSPSPACCSQAAPTAALHPKGLPSYSMVVEALPWHAGMAGGSMMGYKLKEEQAPIIQVYARGSTALRADGSPVLEAELVWDSNIYFVARCRAVRGARALQPAPQKV